MIHDAGSDHLAHFEQSHPTDSSLGKTRRNLCKNLLVQHVLQVVERLAVMKLQNEPLWNVLQMDRWHDQQRFRSILDNQGFVSSELNPLECWSWFPQTLRWMLENKKGSSFSKSFHFVEYQPKKCRNGRLNRTACSTDAGGRVRPVDPGHTAFSTSSRQLSMCRNSSPGCKISSKQVRWLTLPGSSETCAKKKNSNYLDTKR